MEQKNGHCVLFLREETHKMNVHFLNGSSELRKLVDTGLACFPATVIKVTRGSGTSGIDYQSKSFVHCSLRLFNQSDVIP